MQALLVRFSVSTGVLVALPVEKAEPFHPGERDVRSPRVLVCDVAQMAWADLKRPPLDGNLLDIPRLLKF